MGAREVPIRTKILYGVGDMASNIKNSTINLFLLFFYADVLDASPAHIGIAIFVGKLWDALIDPVMGYVSDITTSRWGRRRPYVLISGIPMGICFYLLFAPPPLSPTMSAVYLAVVAIALYTFFTIFAIPYFAWGAELVRDYHERTEVVQIRSLFGVLGGAIGAAAPVAIAKYVGDARLGYAWVGAIFGTLIAASALTTALCVRDQPVASAGSSGFRHFVGGLKQTVANRQFFIVFFTFFLMTVSASLGNAVQLVVIKYRLQLYDAFAVIAIVFALSFAGSFPFWQLISRRIGKQRALMGGLLLGCVAPLGWIVVQPGQLGAMLVFMVIAGVLTGSVTLAISQAADVIDLDELSTGEKRAGAYFGVWTLGLKTAGALGVLLGGLLLSVVGYVPDQPQSDSTMWWLVMVVGPLQAVVHLVAYLIFRGIRIDASDILRTQAELDARRAAL